MCSQLRLPGRDLNVDEWNTSALESHKDTTALYLYLLFSFFLLCHNHEELSDLIQEDLLVLPTERKSIFLWLLWAWRTELRKQSQADFGRQHQRANDWFTALFFVCLHLCELLQRRRRTVHSDVHETQATRKLSGNVLTHLTLNEIFWKIAVDEVKCS